MATVPQSERLQVAILRAKVESARAAWSARRKARSDALRRMLAGETSVTLTDAPGMSVAASGGQSKTAAVIAAVSAAGDEANLPLLATTLVKAEVTDGRWDVRYTNAGDVPDEILGGAQEFNTKIIEAGCAQDEVADAVDDGATVGPMIVKFGVETEVIERERLAGGSSGAANDLIESAKAGDPEAHPLPGMDFAAVAKSLRDIAADPYMAMSLEQAQIENMYRVAQECDAMLEEEQDAKPAGFRGHGDVWYRRVVYAEDVVWDPTVTTSWRDADWVAFFGSMSLEDAREIKAWKASARKALTSMEMPAQDGWPTAVVAGEFAGSAEAAEINKRVRYIEFWDRRKDEVHYFLECAGSYEGFLERDARYPYNDSRGRSVLRWWYPMACVTPIKHNLRRAERTWGKPFIEPGHAHAIKYAKFYAAAMSACSKAGAIVEVPQALTPEQRDAIEYGGHLTVVETPATNSISGDKPLIKIHEFGNVPPEYFQGMEIAARNFARAVGLTGPELTGVPVAETATQEVEATSGVRTVRGGLIQKIETLAGDLAYAGAALSRLFYSDEKVTEMMGEDFTRREPMMKPHPGGLTNPSGEPVMVPATDPATGQPVMLPSMWDLFKASSLLGDRIEVQFSASARADDAVRQRSTDNFVALVATQANPLVPGAPRFDVGPILEREARARKLGALKPWRPSQEDIAMAQALAPAPQEAEGSPEDGAEDRSEGGGKEAEGGGRKDGRKAHGQRGPAGVPGRQSRERAPGSFGHQGSAANRPTA